VKYSFRILVAWLGWVCAVFAQDTVAITIHSNIASATFSELDGVRHTSLSNTVKVYVPACCWLEHPQDGFAPLASVKVSMCLPPSVFDGLDKGFALVPTYYSSPELPWLLSHLSSGAPQSQRCAE
jgi:hypothetical protein